LIVEALEYALTQSNERMAAQEIDADKRAATPLQSVAGERHLKNPGSGCALYALAGEARHAGPDNRALLPCYLRHLTSCVAQSMASGDGKSAFDIVATIAGAITLARAVDGDGLARSILSSSLALVTT
jgi:TetR/AcrR family transcriptional repressor of nem operon